MTMNAPRVYGRRLLLSALPILLAATRVTAAQTAGSGVHLKPEDFLAPVLDPMLDGATEVKGRTGARFGRVAIRVGGSATDLCADASTPKGNVMPEGTFTVKMLPGTKLNAKDNVVAALCYLDPDNKPQEIASGPKPVKGNPLEGVKVDLIPVKEGDNSVRGFVRGDVEIDKVKITLLESRRGQQGVVVDDLAVTLDKDKKQFTASYPLRFAEGQALEVTLCNGSNCKSVKLGELDVVRPAGYDWGRVKAYFALGSSFAREGDNFGKANVLVGLTIDYNWFSSFQRRLILRQEDGGKQYEALNRKAQEAVDLRIKRPSGTNTKTQPTDKEKREREAALGRVMLTQWTLNTYSRTLLTQTPSAKGDAKFDLSQSLNSGSAEFGVYVPIYPAFTQWTFHNLRNGLYIAPLVKGGFVTIKGAEGNTVVPTGVYSYWAGGLRFGHSAIKDDINNAPDAISYVDFAVGKFGNFRRPTKNPTSSSGGFEKPTRVDVSGFYKIPRSPVFVTLGVNTGAGADDFRFGIGVRVDLAQYLAKFLPTVGN